MSFLASFQSLWGPILGAAFLFYHIGRAFYRLYLSPLAKFPGPKLAALTLWYEGYYDIVKRGQYTFEIGRMHEKYGPIVRISPFEIHISDPDYYEELYNGIAKKRDKYPWALKIFGAPDAAIATPQHDHHRLRRGAMNQFFSKASVRRVEPIIQKHLDRLLVRLREFQRTREPIPLNTAFGAFTSDIITEYSFGRSYNYLDADDFNLAFSELMLGVHKMTGILKHVPGIIPLMEALPNRLTTLLNPARSAFLDLQRSIRSQIVEIKDRGNHDREKASLSILEALAQSNLPEGEKTVRRLTAEGQVLVIAGTETTAWTLSVITFYLLSNPPMLRRLREELDQVAAESREPATCTRLEKLPYLTGIIKEGLRLSYGVSTRLQRVSPNKAMTFFDGNRDWQIPPGTPVSMTSTLIHQNPTIFPSPHEFRPERWLENARLDRYLVSFSKGSRQCLGMNLAYTELYLALACIFRQYGLNGQKNLGGIIELFDTTREDVEIQFDQFVAIPKADSKGVRVLIT